MYGAHTHIVILGPGQRQPARGIQFGDATVGEMRQRLTELSRAQHPAFRGLRSMSDGQGSFVVIEGPCGDGKTTITNLLDQQLAHRGVSVLLTKWP